MRVLAGCSHNRVLGRACLRPNSTPFPSTAIVDKEKTPQQIEGEREAERAYKRSLGNITDQGPTDPLGHGPKRRRAKGHCKGCSFEAHQTRHHELARDGYTGRPRLNADQIAYWNDQAAQHWTERPAGPDTLLAPVSDILIDRAKPEAGEQIVDVGCRLRGHHHCVSRERSARPVMSSEIDVSAPMLARARQIAPAGMPVDFVLADRNRIPVVSASLDLMVSRFGVMFFAEPAVSFANMPKGAAFVGKADVRVLARATR